MEKKNKAKKSKTEVNEEKKIFVERLELALEKRKLNLRSNSWLAKEMGLDDQTLQRYKSSEVANKPDITALKKIATYLDVSTDYLLGITDVMSPDQDLRAFCKSTGLSEASVEKISKMSKSKAKIIGELIENDNVGSLVDFIEEYAKKQAGQLADQISTGKKPVTSKDVSVQYIKLLNKKPIINYEAQYDISKGAIDCCQDVVMQEVCDRAFKRVKRVSR